MDDLKKLLNEIQQYTIILNEYNNKTKDNETKNEKNILLDKNILNGGVEIKDNLTEFNLNNNVNSLEFI